MKKVLIHNAASVYDSSVMSNFKSCYNIFFNSGNCFFFYAFEKLLRQRGIPYECSVSYDSNYINDNFCCVIELRANIFSKNTSCLDYYYTLLKGVKVPIFFLTTGIQLNNKSEFHDFIKVIGDKSKRLIDLVYMSGGEFALRGEYSKYFFDKLGTNSAQVTGCVSMLEADRNLIVSNEKISKECFRPMLNGHNDELKQDFYVKSLKKYITAEYFDQDQFAYALYGSKHRDYVSLVRQCTAFGVDLLKEKRVNLFYSIPEWKSYIKNRSFNFSFGSRIHGSILPLTQGIPSLVHSKDLRVKELCDFYSIPYIENQEIKDDLFDLYLKTDYTEFNKNFASKYDLIKNFIEKNIIENLGIKETRAKQFNDVSIDIDQFHLKKVTSKIRIPSRIELYIRLYIMYILLYMFKKNSVGGNLNIRTIQYLLGKLKC